MSPIGKKTPSDGAAEQPECTTADCACTIEGLAKTDDPKEIDELSPFPTAFLVHDGDQRGYCTPGQIVSATALLKEQKR